LLESSQSASLDLLEKTSLEVYSDDPFMGWASKRSSQMCEDYGWVLSHVETL
jgi:hypothetical protein